MPLTLNYKSRWWKVQLVKHVMKGSGHPRYFFSQKLIHTFSHLISKCLLSPQAPLTSLQWELKIQAFSELLAFLKG